MDKAKIREEIIAERKKLSNAFIEQASAEILNRVKQLISADKNVFVYISMPGEVLTSAFFKEYKNASVPRCLKGGRMEAVKGFTCLKTTPFGTSEPVDGAVTDDIYAAIVPGLAFSRRCDRIGFGAGFYDRFLKEHNGIIKIGVCFDFQVRDDFVAEMHDVKMDCVITEKRIIKGAYE